MISKVLNRDFVPRGWLESRSAWVGRFLSGWNAGTETRKPFPGFHPGIYRDHHPDLRGDPTIHYLENGKQEGPWSWEVIGEQCEQSKGKSTKGRKEISGARVALHLHLHYTDGAEALLHKIAGSFYRPDLLISVTGAEGKERVTVILDKCDLKAKEIAIFPNRGRDLGPFLTGFRHLLKDYEIIGHFHTKASKHAPQDYVKRWNAFLEGNLIGHRGRMMGAILDGMISDPKIGIVYPDDPIVWGWYENYPMARSVLERMKLTAPDEKKSVNFPAGSMFWARTEALRPLFDLHLGWEDYPEEPVPQDGTILHTIERLFGIIPGQIGYRTAMTYVPGLKRS